MKEHSIETVKSSQLKFGNVIVGSFCKAIYVFDKPVNKKSSYKKHKTGDENYIGYVKSFHFITCTNNTLAVDIEGVDIIKQMINDYDLRLFRRELKLKTK